MQEQSNLVPAEGFSLNKANTPVLLLKIKDANLEQLEHLKIRLYETFDVERINYLHKISIAIAKRVAAINTEKTHKPMD